MRITSIFGVACAIVSAAGLFSSAEAQDADLGKRTFNQCRACHTIDAVKSRPTGPSLYGVVGRTPGTFAGFKYSSAMSEFGAYGKVWTEALLDEYLTKPRNVVPRTRMAFPGLRKAEDRANVIAYLKSVVED